MLGISNKLEPLVLDFNAEAIRISANLLLKYVFVIQQAEGFTDGFINV
jgi:hypothetical protein